MPVTSDIDPELRLVRLAYVDPFTLDEWRDAMQRVRTARGFGPGFRWIVDRRGAAAPSTEFAKGIAAFLDRHRDAIGASRVAILIHDSSTAHGMGRMQEALNDFVGIETRAFKTEADALAWLGVR